MSIKGTGTKSVTDHTLPRGQDKPKSTGTFYRWLITIKGAFNSTSNRGHKPKTRSLSEISMMEVIPHSETTGMMTPSSEKQHPLSTNAFITAEHLKLGEFYDSVADTLMTPPLPDPKNPKLSLQFLKDNHRNSSQTLTVHHESQETTVKKDVLPLLETTVNKLPAKDKEALLRRLSEYCSQTPSNQLSATIHVYFQSLLPDDIVTPPSSQIEKHCKLTCTPTAIHAQLSITCNSLTHIPAGKDLTSYKCDTEVKVTVTIPLDEPDKCTVGPIQLTVNMPSEPPAAGIIERGSEIVEE